MIHTFVTVFDHFFWGHLQVHVENLCAKQVENEIEARGPPVSKAFDQHGNPTKVFKFIILL